MKTAWDYSKLATHYVKRPPYDDVALDRMCTLAGLLKGISRVCDIGAGTGILTKALLERGFVLTAIEPNDAMRAIGKDMTEPLGGYWREGTAEETGMPNSAFDMVTFGSSFNTTDRQAALRETARILKPGGWFACMWNHRDLDEPTQRQVEDCIKGHLPEYSHGTRREDQTAVIRASGLFHETHYLEHGYTAAISTDEYVEAWRSHATLQRHAGERFDAVVEAIRELLSGRQMLSVPYVTRLWMAQKLLP